MIYIDSSVALAYILDEARKPGIAFWQADLYSSRLLEYEVWTRIHARKLTDLHSGNVRAVLAEIEMLELGTAILARASDPFPVRIRTLDALHLATMDFLRREGQEIELACYDNRLNTAARALRIPLYAV